MTEQGAVTAATTGKRKAGSFAEGYHEGREDTIDSLVRGHQWATEKLASYGYALTPIQPVQQELRERWLSVVPIGKYGIWGTAKIIDAILADLAAQGLRVVPIDAVDARKLGNGPQSTRDMPGPARPTRPPHHKPVG